MNLDNLRRQIELLRLRQQASRIALRLFEAATNQIEIDEVNSWFEVCNSDDQRAIIEHAMAELKKIAQAKNIPIDL